MQPLKICFVASEAAPFAKTGGLADVAQALPAHLRARGHDVRVFMPFYSRIDTAKHDFAVVDFLRRVEVSLGAHLFTVTVFVGRAEGSDVDVYFIDCPQLYHRGGIYTGDRDEHLRFSLLSRGAIESCQRMGWGPDVFHCNDWHAALVPLYLKTIYGWDELFARSKTVLTIHNIAFQGIFPAEVVSDLGLDEHRHLLFQQDLEEGAVNFLKTGVLYADVVTAVSRTYAREIQTPAYGNGLDTLLRERASSVVGIVNGVDYAQWSPEKDPFIPHNYGLDDVARGKARNKRHLLEQAHLLPSDTAPVIGVVSRLTSQKGFELTYEALPQALRHLDVRAVILGSGESGIVDHFHWLQRTFPEKVSFYKGYHEELAHLIEAGSDIFLMPSRFEPCGLNQMYSLKYGTVPIVRKTGGLADTVEHFDPATGEGTGFVFEHYDSTGFAWALKTALETWQDQESWAKLRRNGMEKDFSWDRQGAQYEELYAQLTGRG